jgi:hypothetical protein
MITLSCHDFAADMDLYGSIENPLPYFLESTFSSFRPGDEYRGVTICPPEGQTKGKKKNFMWLIF